MKRIIISTLVIFVIWQITDFLIHGLMLKETYEATAELWRPMAEMKRPLMMFVSLVGALSFCLIFGMFFKEQGIKKGLLFGLIYGVSAGFSMGFGTYAFQAIPMSLALSWMLGTVFQALLAGIIAGFIIKE